MSRAGRPAEAARAARRRVRRSGPRSGRSRHGRSAARRGRRPLSQPSMGRARAPSSLPRRAAAAPASPVVVGESNGGSSGSGSRVGRLVPARRGRGARGQALAPRPEAGSPLAISAVVAVAAVRSGSSHSVTSARRDARLTSDHLGGSLVRAVQAGSVSDGDGAERDAACRGGMDGPRRRWCRRPV